MSRTESGLRWVREGNQKVMAGMRPGISVFGSGVFDEEMDAAQQKNLLRILWQEVLSNASESRETLTLNSWNEQLKSRSTSLKLKEFFLQDDPYTKPPSDPSDKEPYITIDNNTATMHFKAVFNVGSENKEEVNISLTRRHYPASALASALASDPTEPAPVDRQGLGTTSYVLDTQNSQYITPEMSFALLAQHVMSERRLEEAAMKERTLVLGDQARAFNPGQITLSNIQPKGTDTPQEINLGNGSGKLSATRNELTAILAFLEAGASSILYTDSKDKKTVNVTKDDENAIKNLLSQSLQPSVNVGSTSPSP